jgi:hypothetical protein
MPAAEDAAGESLEVAERRRRRKPTPEEVKEQGDRLIAAVQGADFSTIDKRVAWILNHSEDARNSDVALWIEYYQNFQREYVVGGGIPFENLDKVVRPYLLTRSRAAIQNTYKLFLAREEVRQQRGVLDTEQREIARARLPPPPSISVWADESGKNLDYLLVGSIWFLHPPEIVRMQLALRAWRAKTGFKDELHFVDLRGHQLDRYKEAADIIAAEAAAASFKVISVERRGHRDQDLALRRLLYFLMVLGVEHEDETGRATLPRSLLLTKDREGEEGRDQLFVAELREELIQAGHARFGGRLRVENVQAKTSHADQLVQVADLFTGSVNRILNPPPGAARGVKDEFAEYFLRAVGMPEGPTTQFDVGDMSVRLAL